MFTHKNTASKRLRPKMHRGGGGDGVVVVVFYDIKVLKEVKRG